MNMMSTKAGYLLSITLLRMMVKNNKWRARTTGWMPCTWKKVTVVVDSRGAGNVMPRNMFLEIVVEELNGPREARASKAQEEKHVKNESARPRMWAEVTVRPDSLWQTTGSRQVREIHNNNTYKTIQCNTRKHHAKT